MALVLNSPWRLICHWIKKSNLTSSTTQVLKLYCKRFLCWVNHVAKMESCYRPKTFLLDKLVSSQWSRGMTQVLKDCLKKTLTSKEIIYCWRAVEDTNRHDKKTVCSDFPLWNTKLEWKKSDNTIKVNLHSITRSSPVATAGSLNFPCGSYQWTSKRHRITS